MTYRFPKWLLEETFTVTYYPQHQKFVIALRGHDDPLATYTSSGETIAEAAKEARKQREKSK